MKHIIILTLLTIINLFITGCSNDFPLNKDISIVKTELTDSDSAKVTFPDFISGRTTLIGFIYTNCPDICPLTTNNMQLVQKQLAEEGIDKINFVLISFDPERDTPFVLKKYAEIRKLDTQNWHLVTGEKNNLNRVLDLFDVQAFPGDTTISPTGKIRYYMIHTDRISLVDKNHRLRKNYPGSTADIGVIVNDIKKLGE
ncbi:MAG: hypothetical protein Kow0098_19280 [Ignavibacteriaceae bacterium]